MIWAIISDIHSNLYALDKVLSEIGQVDQIYCLGDIVGYGPHPGECVDMVREHDIAAILGNHEGSVTKKKNWNNSNPLARATWEDNMQKLTREQLNYLEDLKMIAYKKMPDHKVWFTHSSFDKPREYGLPVRDSTRAAEQFALMKEKDVLFLGHTHVPAIHTPKFSITMDEYNGTLDDKAIVNVGSVGQPRGQDPRASYLLYDPARRYFELRKTEYDIKRTCSDVQKMDMPKGARDAMCKRLRKGR